MKYYLGVITDHQFNVTQKNEEVTLCNGSSVLGIDQIVTLKQALLPPPPGTLCLGVGVSVSVSKISTVLRVLVSI